MKKFKRIMALVIALVMVVAMALPTFAATNVNLNVNPTTGHTYKYYQLFTGDLAEDGKTLSNVKWGADVKTSEITYDTDKTVTPEVGAAVPKEVLDYLETLTGKSGTDPAQDTADIISAWVTGTGHDLTSTAVQVPTGYYVVKDSFTNPTDNQTTTLSTNIVEIVGPTTIQPKDGSTTSDKEIVPATEVTVTGQDAKAITYDLDSDTKHEAGDADIGGTVNYKLSGTVPANAAYFDYYFFVFNDTLGKGLTLNTSSTTAAKSDFTVKIDGTATEAFNFEVEKDATSGETTIHIYMTDAKSAAGKTITVEYSATVNENANIGDTANENTSNVTFSNDPNKDYNGENDSSTPGKPKDSSKEIFGETPEQKTQTYTTGIEIQKVDENGDALKGAEFTITGPSTKIVLVSSEVFTQDTTGTYYKLTDNTYTETPPTEDTYNEIGTGSAETTEGYIYSNGNYIIPENVEDYVGQTIYEKVSGTASKYVKNGSEYAKYKKTVTFSKVGEDQEETTIKASVGDDGVVIFEGLNEGKYTISETKTPDGYNTIADFDITITFTASPATGASHWSATSDIVKTSTNTDGTVTYADGVFKIDVVNESGTELPSTGGIGTTIFYVVGAILVIGAGVIMITRRRMDA